MPKGPGGPDRIDTDASEIGAPSTDAFDAVTFTDDELEELALAAPSFDPFAPDVEPFIGNATNVAAGLLPDWYMPVPGTHHRRWHANVFGVIAIAIVTTNIGGFCVTYGFPEFVWN